MDWGWTSLFKDFVVKYAVEAVGGIIIAGLGVAYKCLSQKVQKQIIDQKALRDGTLALLRSEIIRNYDTYRGRQWIPIYAMENVCALYSAYHELGGNGTITKLVEELRDLPSKTKAGDVY